MKRLLLGLAIVTSLLVAMSLPASAAKPVTGVTMEATTCYGTSADVEATVTVAPGDAKLVKNGTVVITWYSKYATNDPIAVIGPETVNVTGHIKRLASGPYGLAAGYSFWVTAVGSNSVGGQVFDVSSSVFTVDAACA